MTQHTEGEWHVSGDGMDILSAEGRHIATCANSLLIDEREANVQLLAAAPMLLEALQLLQAEMILSGNAGSEDFGWKPAIQKARAAIAAATGEQA